MKNSNRSIADRVWQPGQHLPELDGVRGFAILIVSIYRFSKEVRFEGSDSRFFHALMGFGERGVELFFVLSGLLITGILLEAKEKGSGLRIFFARRALRIFPLYFFSVFLFLVVLPWVWGSPHPFELASQQQLYLWTHLTNLRMSYLNQWCFGYFDHFWSLAVEEHFYFLWPWLVFAFRPRSLFVTAIGLAIIGTIARVLYAAVYSNSLAPHVLTPFRFDALCVGAALAVALRQGMIETKHLVWAKRVIVVSFVLVLVPTLSGKRLLTIPDIGWTTIWGAGLLLIACLPKTHWMSGWMRASWLRTLGKYSYAMYVFQSPLIPVVAGVVSFPIIRAITGENYSAAAFYVTSMLSLTFAAALLSWHLIEKHFLRLKPTATPKPLGISDGNG